MKKKLSFPALNGGFTIEILAYTAIAIGILLRFLNLGSREFWYDEVLSLLVSTGQAVDYQGPRVVPVDLSSYTHLLSLPPEQSIGDIIQTIKNIFKGLLPDVHPPLSFLGLHLWLRLFGNSETALRSLSALTGTAAIGSAYGLGRSLRGHRLGLLLAALLATNPYYLFHSLNIRMYAGIVLWAITSAWALWELIRSRDENNLQIVWNVLLIGSVTAGLLTQYLFANWVIILGIFVLIFDRQKWWQHGLRLGTAVLLTVPWVVWGMRQQLRNRPNLGGQFDRPGGLQHLTDVAQTLSAHLVWGDWVTNLPIAIVTITGCAVILGLIAGAIDLWRQGERRLLLIALVFGIFPLLLALAVDIVTSKFTVGFGEGRTVIFILPGCLLLIALWLEKAGKVRVLTSFLLLLYLTISIGNYTLQQRLMFHQVAEVIQQKPATPTLVLMNSRAWGHVLRLAYYTPPKTSVKLLARDPAQLAPDFQSFLADPTSKQYPRLIWLESANPVWSRWKTEAERENQHQKMLEVLQDKFQLTKNLQLTGTMSIDNFNLNIYDRSPST